MDDKVIAIVPAAGVGKRFGEGTNKTFEGLCGKPLIMYAVEALQSLSEICEIIPVMKETDMEYGIELFERYNIAKVKRIAPGGKERQDSVFHGLRLIDDKDCAVLIHDGARPLIGLQVIRDAISQFMSCENCDGLVVGVPVKDTIKEVSGGYVKGTLKRDTLWSVQTPQIFRYEKICAAYQKAIEESYYSTDDSALVERYGGRIKMLMGSYTNIKITTPEDILAAATFLKNVESRA